MHNVNHDLRDREDKLAIGYDKTVAQTHSVESLNDFTESNNWIGAPTAPPRDPHATPTKCDLGLPLPRQV